MKKTHTALAVLTSLFFCFCPPAFGGETKPEPSSKRAGSKSSKPSRDLDQNSGQPFPADGLLNLKEFGKVEALVTFQPEQSPDVIPERSELLKEFGVGWGYRRRIGGTVVTVLRFRHPYPAFGAFCALRPEKQSGAVITHDSWVGNDQAGFWTSEEVVLLTGPPDDPNSGETLRKMGREITGRLKAWHENLPNRDPEASGMPYVVRHLPFAGLDPATVRYAVGQIGLAEKLREFPLPGGASLGWAEYVPGTSFSMLAIADYPTPQDAQAALAALEAQVNALPPAEREARLVKRRGNFVLQAFGITNQSEAGQVLDGVRYDYVVQWLGPKPNRGPNQAAEIRKTGVMLVSIFQLITLGVIGMAVAGVAAGAGYFFWKRRGREYEAAFSDAGGMMRLNLDDHFTAPTETDPAFRRIGDGNP